MIDAVAVSIGLPTRAAPRPVHAWADATPRGVWSRTVDTVELARGGPDDSPPSDATTVRDERISRVRAQIASRTYLTDEKLAIALDRMQRELRGDR